MWTTIARILLRNRILFLVIVGLVTVFMLFQAQNIKMGYGFAVMMPDEDSVSIENALFEETFGEAGNTVVIALEDENFFTLDRIQAWQKYTDSLTHVEGVENVISITNTFDLTIDTLKDELTLLPLLEGEVQTEEEVAAFKERILSLPFYKNLLYSEEGKVIMLLVRIEQDALYDKQIISTIEDIKSLNENFEKRANIKIHASGLPYIRMANTKRLELEVYLLIFFTILITTLLLYAFLRSFRATLISLLIVVLGVIFTFGLLGFFGFEISIISSLIPPLVIVIGVPNCIYLINKYHQEYKAHSNKIKALQRVIRKIGNVTVMTNFTTALGFATFILTDSLALVEFGIVASSIILLVFLLSIILIPIIYSYLKPPKERHYSHFNISWIQGMLNFLVNAVTNHRPRVYLTALVLLSIGVYGMFQLRVTGNLTGDFSKKDPVYLDIKFIEKKFKGVMPLEIVVESRAENGITRLSTLKKIDEFQSKIAELPKVSRSLSIVDFVKFSRQGILFGNPDMYALPSRQEQQWMKKYIPRNSEKKSMVGTLVDSTGRKARISMQIEDLGTTEMRDLQNQITTYAKDIFEKDKYKITITGASVKYVRTTDYLIKNLAISMLLAIVLISFMMAFLFGSAKMVFISIIPNMIPLLLTAGLMGYLGIPLKPSTILTFSIAFGISIDDTIHYLARYRQELKSNGWRIGEAAKVAIQDTGISMFYTSVILFFGFSVFLMSTFGGTQALGFLVAITLIFAMLTNLLILPAFLMSLDKRIRARDFSENIIEIINSDDDLEEEDEETNPN